MRFLLLRNKVWMFYGTKIPNCTFPAGCWRLLALCDLLLKEGVIVSGGMELCCFTMSSDYAMFWLYEENSVDNTLMFLVVAELRCTELRTPQSVPLCYWWGARKGAERHRVPKELAKAIFLAEGEFAKEEELISGSLFKCLETCRAPVGGWWAIDCLCIACYVHMYVCHNYFPVPFLHLRT